VIEEEIKDSKSPMFPKVGEKWKEDREGGQREDGDGRMDEGRTRRRQEQGGRRRRQEQGGRKEGGRREEGGRKEGQGGRKEGVRRQTFQ
jgi:hypothetical protein